MPVFVDVSGRRRKLVTGFGWLVALACVAYLGVIGVSMTGTSVGPLPDLPSVASRAVVFGADTAGLPQGALEAPLPAPAQPAAAPNWGVGARAAGTTAAVAAPKLAPTIVPRTGSTAGPKGAPKSAVAKPPTVVPSTTRTTGLAANPTRSSTSGGASR